MLRFQLAIRLAKIFELIVSNRNKGLTQPQCKSLAALLEEVYYGEVVMGKFIKKVGTYNVVVLPKPSTQKTPATAEDTLADDIRKHIAPTTFVKALTKPAIVESVEQMQQHTTASVLKLLQTPRLYRELYKHV